MTDPGPDPPRPRHSAAPLPPPSPRTAADLASWVEYARLEYPHLPGDGARVGPGWWPCDDPPPRHMTAAEVRALVRADRRRRVLAELAADRRAVNRGMLRLMLACHHRRLVAEVAEALATLRGRK